MLLQQVGVLAAVEAQVCMGASSSLAGGGLALSLMVTLSAEAICRQITALLEHPESSLRPHLAGASARLPGLGGGGKKVLEDPGSFLALPFRKDVMGVSLWLSDNEPD